MRRIYVALGALATAGCGLVGVDTDSDDEAEGATAQAGVASAPRQSGDEPSAPPAAAAFGVPGMTPEQVTDGVRAALDAVREGRDAIDAAVHGAAALERLACQRRLTESVRSCALLAPQVDAAVMDSTGKFGSVLLLEQSAHPVFVAQAVAATPFLTLVGDSALAFSGLAAASPQPLPTASPEAASMATAPEDTARVAAAPPAPAVMGSLGLFGVLVRTGTGAYAGAVSTEWAQRVPRGRASAVPYVGAALYAGTHGAVAVSGDVNALMRKQIARKVHDEIADGAPLREVVEQSVQDAGSAALSVVALGQRTSHAASNRRMPWAQLALKSDANALD